ncbi:MAG: NAD-dependent epimerase/dehydratase family protein [Pseudomonadota bacterium]
MFEITTEAPVLVTGATGFVAGWIVKALLEAGVTVHATVRDPTDTGRLEPLDKIAQAAPGAIRYFRADLLENGTFEEAMAGCRIVFHTASPFTSRISDPQRDLVDPALLGTRNVLSAVERSDSVQRLVLTSSVVAMYGDAADLAALPGQVLTEAAWNTTSSVAHQAYSYSKTVAEKEAWAMHGAQSRWSLVVINPALVLGPSVAGVSTSESHNLIRQIADGTLKTGAPPITLGVVDVRDVATAHLRAAFDAAAEGRHIVSAESRTFLDLARMLRLEFGERWPFPKSEAPKWLVWLAGPMIDKSITRRFVARNLGYPWKADNSKSKQALGLQYSPISKAVVDMFRQMVDTGSLRAPG